MKLGEIYGDKEVVTQQGLWLHSGVNCSKHYISCKDYISFFKLVKDQFCTRSLYSCF